MDERRRCCLLPAQDGASRDAVAVAMATSLWKYGAGPD
ncbi:MAG: Uncharacterised protein [Prochlorococcus marinus str. MIT 9215]|nr:MAG: Uncharacterised protein [Prochlorococcus marinus str. MIT 9215]